MPDIITISDVSQIPATGKVVVIVLVEVRAPCRKFLNNCRSAVTMLESQDNPPLGASYFFLPMSDIVKEALTIRAMPVAIVYKDGVEVKRIEGHWNTQFVLHDEIKGALSA